MDLKEDGGAVALCIATNGNVGIGTTNPGSPLEVEKTGGFGAVVDLLILDSNNAGLNGGGILVFKGVGAEPERTKIKATYQGSINGDLRFYTKPGYRIGLTEQMRITPNGNVGIETNDTGNDKLDFRGRCYSSGGW